jgi:hypothetical protein
MKFPKYLGEINNNILRILMDEQLYEFNILLYVKNGFNIQFIFESSFGKIIIDFDISPRIEGGNDVRVIIQSSSNSLEPLVRYIRSKLMEYFSE